MRYCTIILLAFMFTACADRPSEFLPAEKFNSIFANAAEGADYEPLDVIQTEDNGYLILAESALDAVFVMKISNLGKLIWSTTMPATFENPVGDFVFNEGKYYFIAASQANQTASLIEVDDFNQTVVPTQRTYVGYRNPLAFGRLDDDSFLMLNYNDTTGPVLSKIQAGFAQEWARRFDDGALSTSQFQALKEDPSINFFVGAFNNGTNIYFNCLRDSAFALTYTDSEGIETGKISGTLNDRVVSYNYLGNNVGAINYIQNGSSFFQISLPLQANTTTVFSELSGEKLLEKGVLGNAQIVNDEIVATSSILNLYGTIDGRIKWTNYDVASGAIQNVDYVGGSDLITLKKAKKTRDGGLLILSKVTLAGSRDRIAIQKIAQDELRNIQ